MHCQSFSVKIAIDDCLVMKTDSEALDMICRADSKCNIWSGNKMSIDTLLPIRVRAKIQWRFVAPIFNPKTQQISCSTTCTHNVYMKWIRLSLMLGKASESLLMLVQTHSWCAGEAQTYPHSFCKGRKKKSLLGTAEKSMASVRSSGTHHDYLHHSLRITFLRITGKNPLFLYTQFLQTPKTQSMNATHPIPHHFLAIVGIPSYASEACSSGL
jgi:hypothetical protein